MNINQYALRNPAGIAIVVAVIFLFGLYSLTKLPLQLFPDIEEPELSIQTGWRAASPREIESEILEPLEEVLQGLPGMHSLESNAGPGWSWINLTFGLDTDMQQTLIEVISRLNRLPPLPRDATPPQIQLSGGGGGDANSTLIWFFVQLLPGTPGPVEDYQRTVLDIMKPRLESIPGVSTVEIPMGAEEELQIVFDPYRAAELGIQIPAVAALAGTANDVSGGFVDVGRRQYTLRFAGRYTPEQLRGLILDWRDGRPVRLGDIADIAVQRGDQNNIAIQNGNPAMGIRVGKETGANVLDTLNAVKVAVDELRDGSIRELGLDIRQSFDASVFIYRAVGLVTGNLFIGVLLAIGVLWWFMRQMRATVLVAIAIPLALLGTFVVLNISGRTLNVISLAGLAFAVGMVLDAAIVVLENIVRLKEKGESIDAAAEKGTAQVWGALLASTATTVAIFVPVIFLKDAEGQLFADLALTIAIAVVISLLVAVTVLPTLATRYLGSARNEDMHQGYWVKAAGKILKLTDTPKRRYGLIAGLMSLPVIATAILIPKLDYLPPVKRDAVDAFFQFPPGASTDTIDQEIVQVMAQRLQPYMDGVREPALKNYYILVWPGGGTIGARVLDQSRVDELVAIIRDEVTAGFPDTRAFVAQGNLFGGFGDGRSISIHMQSSDIQALLSAARVGMGIIEQKLPGSQVRPWPGTELAEPELRLTPYDERINEVGWNRATVANIVRALGDGVWIGEHFDGEKRLDVVLRADGWGNPEELASVPLATPSGIVVPLGELMHVQRTVGPSQIRRIDRRRTVTLDVSPPPRVSLEEALKVLQEEVEPELMGVLPADRSITYGGSADSLSKAVRNMSENFIIAIGLLFMLMAALFRSLRDSLLVMLCLPLATVGGVIAIRVLNLFTFQPLDLLTMIGFIILMGLVVNNAILLVHQTRIAEHNGLNRRDAVEQALKIRLRPIFMSTLTSLFGMFPLLLMPGAGSVIYRGLATVIVGGMSVSLVFTLVLLPSLLRLGEEKTAVTSDAREADGGVHSSLEHAT
ncbi:MAG: efflux RND transporter permease subunit [Gammaproteobacteria bacterium]